MSVDFPKMFSHTNLATLWLLMVRPMKPGNAETLTQGKQKGGRTHCSEVRLQNNSTHFRSQQQNSIYIRQTFQQKRQWWMICCFFPKMFAHKSFCFIKKTHMSLTPLISSSPIVITGRAPGHAQWIPWGAGFAPSAGWLSWILEGRVQGSTLSFCDRKEREQISAWFFNGILMEKVSSAQKLLFIFGFTCGLLPLMWEVCDVAHDMVWSSGCTIGMSRPSTR